jgi:hypothetical protein
MVSVKVQIASLATAGVLLLGGFITMLVLYLLKPGPSPSPPSCKIQLERNVPPPNVPVEQAGPYSLPTAKFAMALTTEITQAYQQRRPAQAYPGTKILTILNGVDNPAATDDDWNTHRMQAVGFIVQVPSKNQIWIAFRGSQTELEEKIDFAFAQMEWNRTLFPGALVHSGFYSAYLEIQSQILDTLRKYANPDTTVFVTGISLGSALSVLTIADLAIAQRQLGIRDIRVYTFGPPKVGNAVFVDGVTAQLKIQGSPLREAFFIANLSDIVPKLPMDVGPETYQAMPLTTFNADWSGLGYPGNNHLLPVHAAHLDRVVNPCPDPKAK